MISIGIPQAIYLLLALIGLCAAFARGKYEGTPGALLFTWLFVTVPLLYWGGFFS